MDKSGKTALQNCTQVYTIWKTVSPHLDINHLVDMDQVEDKWLNHFLSVFKPRTSKSYQGSIVLFLEFLKFLPKRADATEAIARLKKLCKGMRKSSSDVERKQKWRAWVSLVYELFSQGLSLSLLFIVWIFCLVSLLTPSKITKSLTSATVKSIESVLTSPREPSSPPSPEPGD